MKKTILLAVAFAAFVGISSASAQTWQQHNSRGGEMGNRYEGRDMRGDRDFRGNDFAYGRDRFDRRDGRMMMRRHDRDMYYMRHGYNGCQGQMMYR